MKRVTSSRNVPEGSGLSTSGSTGKDHRSRGDVTSGQRWLARLAIASVLAAVAVLLINAGLNSPGLVLVGVGGLAVSCAGLWWFLTSRGLVRWVSAALAVGAPLAVLIWYGWSGVLWAVVVALALVAVAVAAGRAALSSGAFLAGMPEHETAPPTRPFLVMNPRSGGGKVGKFDLKRKAQALGAEVALLEGPEQVDVVSLAREAVARGADLLGVAGGDGTQALVAEVAAEHGIPFLVLSAGTRNHFALDLGLDREDPAAGLNALTDGVELVVDLGLIGDRTFVNNASFGAYAEVVQSPAYRDAKAGTTLQALPDLLTGQRGAHLVARCGGLEIDSPQAVLVSNNPYGTGDITGMGRRARLDTGMLGVVGVKVSSGRQAVGLLQGRRFTGLVVYTGPEVIVDADATSIPVGVDGEALSLPTPVRCSVRPGALRVRVPRHRPGVKVKPNLDWSTVRRLAATASR